MKIGKRRHKIDFIAPLESQNSIGEVVTSEQVISTRWAEIAPINGTERFLSNQIYAEASVRIKSRYAEGITPKHVIGFGAKRYNIISVSDVGERHIELDILAKEAV
jgi:SPP1 family predicted phage head-tail adaptor